MESVKVKKMRSHNSRPVIDESLDQAICIAMLEAVPTSIMCANKDGVVIYLNQQARETLNILDEHLQVAADDVLGTHFEIFAKSQGPNRKNGVSDAGLPSKALVNVGPEIIEVATTAIYDKDGNFFGPMVSWEIVTDRVELETKNQQFEDLGSAMSKSQAVIEFQPDGTILTANDNFIKALGYNNVNELKGKHHSMFCDPAYTGSSRYRDFWTKLGSGVFDQGSYKRITRDGKEIWIQASYNPIIDKSGKVTKVVKYASDITAQKKASLDLVHTMSETADQLAAAAEQLSATATQMSKNASMTSEKSNTAAANSEEVTKGVQTVATNTEEMVASIKEIARSSSEAAGISKDAMKKEIGRAHV